MRKRNCRENRKKYRETNIPRGTWKTNKALTQDLYHSQRLRASSLGSIESLGGKVSLTGFHALKSWLWRRRNLTFRGFSTKKCRVTELEKPRFERRMRPVKESFGPRKENSFKGPC